MFNEYQVGVDWTDTHGHVLEHYDVDVTYKNVHDALKAYLDSYYDHDDGVVEIKIKHVTASGYKIITITRAR